MKLADVIFCTFFLSSLSRSNVIQNAFVQDCYNEKSVLISFSGKKIRKSVFVFLNIFLPIFFCYGSHDQIFWWWKTVGEIIQSLLLDHLKNT